MKSILLICISVALTFAGFSQVIKPKKEFSLSEIRSSDNLEYIKYTYNNDMLMQSRKVLTEDNIQFIDSLSYDEFNNVARLNTYQLLDTKWVHVFYIDYTYDENGNCLTRTNYNSFGTPEFSIGGTYNYFYDEDNKLTNWELYIGGTDLMQVSNLTYNADGKVIQEIGQNVNWGNYENSYKVDYQYNSDGTLNIISHSIWSASSWHDYTTDLFFYDEHKNCIKWDHKLGTRVVDRNEYDYDMEYTSDQLVMPVEPDAYLDVASLVAMNNKVTIKHWYTMNDNTGELVYICDYIYKYDVIDYTGVPNNGFNADNMRIFPNPAADFITINSGNTIISSIDVVDNAGKIVLQKSNLSKGETKLDVSDLKSGIYYLRALTSKGIVTEKLVVQ